MGNKLLIMTIVEFLRSQAPTSTSQVAERNVGALTNKDGVAFDTATLNPTQMGSGINAGKKVYSRTNDKMSISLMLNSDEAIDGSRECVIHKTVDVPAGVSAKGKAYSAFRSVTLAYAGQEQQAKGESF